MKKLSFYLTLLFRKTISEKVDATQFAREIYHGLIEDKKRPLNALELIEALEVVFKEEMRKEEQRCAEVCRAVNSKWVPEPLNIKEHNEDFDKPLSEIFVNYDIVKAS